MAKDLRYWDACAFSGYLNGEPDKVAECESVLNAAMDGHILIVTSALSLAEVLFIKNGPKLDASKRDTINQFFKSNYITVRNVTRTIGEMARDVFWDFSINPKDAVHIATAVLHKVPLVNTFDAKLLDLSGTSIAGHTLKIERPHQPDQSDMFKEYL